MNEERRPVEFHAIVEILGHRQIARRCTEERIAGLNMLRVDVPAARAKVRCLRRTLLPATSRRRLRRRSDRSRPVSGSSGFIATREASAVACLATSSR